MKKTQAVLIGLSTLALSTLPALAQSSSPRVSPQSIVVNPVNTELQVTVAVNKAGQNPAYRIGEQIQLSVSVNQDAYVYLFSVHADGNIDVILPNKLSAGSTFMRGGETKQFPAANAGFRFTVDGPTGQDKVLAVAAKRQLDISEIARFQAGQQFATAQISGQNNFARALSIVVTPVPAQDWTTSTVSFQVAPAIAQTPAPVQPAPVVTYPSTPVVAQPAPIMNAPQIPWGQYEVAPVQNSYIFNFSSGNDWLHVEFSCGMEAAGVANYYSKTLENKGWRINRFESRKNKIMVGFNRNNEQLKMQLKAHDGHFILEFERDN